MNIRIVRLLVLGALLLVTLANVACAQAPTTTAPDHKDKLPGAWNVDASTINQSTFSALITFTAEGSVIADESPFGYESSGQGSWTMGTDGQVAYTFASLLGGQEGKNTGKVKVVGKLQYDATADRWQGPFNVNVTDASQSELFSDSGTFQLTRFVVEPLGAANPPNPTAIVRAYYAAIKANDIESIMRFFSDDALMTTPEGKFQGKDAIRKYMQGLLDQGYYSINTNYRETNGEVRFDYKVFLGSSQVDQNSDGLTIVKNGKIVFDGLERDKPGS